MRFLKREGHRVKSGVNWLFSQNDPFKCLQPFSQHSFTYKWNFSAKVIALTIGTTTSVGFVSFDMSCELP